MGAVPRAELPSIGGTRIPTLAEALDLLRGRLVNVEVKTDDTPSFLDLSRAVARIVAKDGGRAEVLFSSFDPRVVLALAALAPRVPRGMLVGDRTARLATALPLALRPLIASAHVQEDLLTPARVAQLRRAELRVVAWTVNDPDRAEALASAGVTTIITDAPGRIVSALAPVSAVR